MEKKVKDIFLGLGADVCGIAGIDRFDSAPYGFHPRDLYAACNSVIVFAKHMPKGLSAVSPRIIYNKATDMNLFEMDRIAYLGALAVEELGCAAVPLPSDTPYEYWDETQKEGRGIVSMRHAALLAGIGSMGKNTLILNERYGNRINIGAVLTDLRLESDPLAQELCLEGCRKCLDSCPTGALNGTTVNQQRCRAFTYTTNARGFSVCNCNTCRMICPVGGGSDL